MPSPRVVLVTTITGMDSLDYEGSLAEMGSLLAQGRLRWRDKARFYVRVSEKIGLKSNQIPRFLPLSRLVASSLFVFCSSCV